MTTYDLIFDLGSQYVSGATVQDGFSDKIPSVVAYQIDSKQIVAVGVDALRLANGNSGVKLVNPIMEGAILDVDGAKALILQLLARLVNRKMTAFGRYNVTCVVPCAMISNDKKTVEALFLGLGMRSVTFVETPVADSYQLFGEFRVRQGVIVDIGHDCADLAVVNEDTIVAGCTVYLAGKHLTESIAERIKSKYMIQISFEQAERLKLNCASLYPNDKTVMQVMGTNIQHGNGESVTVSGKELYDTLAEYSRKYIQIVKGLVASVPQEILPYVNGGGIILCGGGAKLSGLDMFLQSELNMPVRVASRPDDVSVAGILEFYKKNV